MILLDPHSISYTLYASPPLSNFAPFQSQLSLGLLSPQELRVNVRRSLYYIAKNADKVGLKREKIKIHTEKVRNMTIQCLILEVSDGFEHILTFRDPDICLMCCQKFTER